MATSHGFNGFLKMGASTADCIWQIAKAIPELLNPLASQWNRADPVERRVLRSAEVIDHW